MPSSLIAVARIVDQRDQRLTTSWPASRAPSTPRAPRLASAEARISGMTSSILATAMARPTRTWARSRALLSRNLVRRDDHLFAERDEGVEQVLQGHHQRAAAVERHDVGAERASAAA